MKVFSHHIYEYQKGLRKLILHTLHEKNRRAATDRLEKLGISYLVREVSYEKINIFFGDSDCIRVLHSFGVKPLNEFSPEEDFILGSMLGYGLIDQCKRYIEYKRKRSPYIESGKRMSA